MANEFQTWPILSDFEYNIKKELIRRKKSTFGIDNKPRATWVRAVSNAVRIVPYLKEIGEFADKTIVALGGDRRPSTPRIKEAVAAAIIDMGAEVDDQGLLASPALALSTLLSCLV